MATDVLTAESHPTAATRAEDVASPICPVSDRAEVGQDPARTLGSVLDHYVQLTKPRIVMMILITTIATAARVTNACCQPANPSTRLMVWP